MQVPVNELCNFECTRGAWFRLDKLLPFNVIIKQIYLFTFHFCGGWNASPEKVTELYGGGWGGRFLLYKLTLYLQSRKQSND